MRGQESACWRDLPLAHDIAWQCGRGTLDMRSRSAYCHSASAAFPQTTGIHKGFDGQVDTDFVAAFYLTTPTHSGRTAAPVAHHPGVLGRVKTL